MAPVPGDGRRAALLATAALVVLLVVVAGLVARFGPDAGGSADVDIPADAGRDAGRGDGDGSVFGAGRVVRTAEGELRGVVDDDGLRSWLGVPYAAPPVGELRWRPPQPGEAWRGVRDARAPGPACVQPDDYAFGQPTLTQQAGSSEDCLYLNVRRPADDRGDLPVMVWLHGGGFFAGSGRTVTDHAAPLVERGVVLVAVNYRLGRLGFFAHPSLAGDVGNFGLLDQVAALRWVQENVGAFGGDPDNVTLVGGSAGGMSVNALMSMPIAEGLFARAIAQSAPSDERSATLARARRDAVADLGPLSAAQLRALPPRDLLSSTFNTLTGDAPLIDAVLPRPAATVFAAGEEQPLPYVTGTTAEEFGDDDYRSFGRDPAILRATIDDDSGGLLAGAYGRSFARDVLDDLVFDLPATERAVQHGRLAPTYRYELDGGPGRSGHGSDGRYLFGPPPAVDRPLSEAVIDYWVAFMRTGVPDVAGLPAWPAVTDAAPSAYLDLRLDGPHARDADPRVPRLRVLRAAVPLP